MVSIEWTFLSSRVEMRPVAEQNLFQRTACDLTVCAVEAPLSDARRHVRAPSRQGRRRLEALSGTGALGAHTSSSKDTRQAVRPGVHAFDQHTQSAFFAPFWAPAKRGSLAVHDVTDVVTVLRGKLLRIRSKGVAVFALDSAAFPDTPCNESELLLPAPKSNQNAPTVPVSASCLSGARQTSATTRNTQAHPTRLFPTALRCAAVPGGWVPTRGLLHQ